MQELNYLVANMKEADSVGSYYRKRFFIETTLSDQKGQSFHLHKSHLFAPAG